MPGSQISSPEAGPGTSSAAQPATPRPTGSPTSPWPTSGAARSTSPRWKCQGSWPCGPEYAGEKPLTGARISGSLHMTVQTAVLIETLVALGRRGALGQLQHLLHPGPRRGRHSARPGCRCSPGRARPWRSTGGPPNKRSTWPDDDGPNMIVDDGGDATLLVHLGVQAERGRPGPRPRAGRQRGTRGHHGHAATDAPHPPGMWTKMAAGIKGVSEETTTGVNRLRQRAAAGALLFPAMNVNDSVTKSKFDNLYGVRHSLDRRDFPGHRRHGGGQGGVRMRLRGRRQGVCPVARGPRGAGSGHRGRPHLRPAGRHGGLPGRDARRCGRRRSTFSSPPPATRTS